MSQFSIDVELEEQIHCPSRYIRRVLLGEEIRVPQKRVKQPELQRGFQHGENDECRRPVTFAR